MIGTLVALSQSGNPVLKLATGPWGESTAAVSAATGATAYPYRYTGQRQDVFANLYDYKARSYMPATGRFTQTDPSGTADNINLYAYASDDPINGSDPTGLGCGTHGNWDDPFCSSGLFVDIASVGATRGGEQAARTPHLAQQVLNDGIAGQINHETLGMRDSKAENESLASAENKMAHVRLNGIKKWGSNEQAQKYASMVSAIENGPGFKISQQAVEQAIREDANGIDPTNGAIYYNMRTESQFKHGGTFQGQTIHTASGPFISPSNYKYIVTYGEPLN
jgi:RHS repeat-associated protein